MSYEKSVSAKIFLSCFSLEIAGFERIPHARVRQTRTRSVRCGGGSLASEYSRDVSGRGPGMSQNVSAVSVGRCATWAVGARSGGTFAKTNPNEPNENAWKTFALSCKRRWGAKRRDHG